jgi:hypothetical protein
MVGRLIKNTPNTQGLIHNTHQNMNKLTYLITENGEMYSMEFITDRTASWTESQYMRNRSNIQMNLIGEEPTDETEPTARKIDF